MGLPVGMSRKDRRISTVAQATVHKHVSCPCTALSATLSKLNAKGSSLFVPPDRWTSVNVPVHAWMLLVISHRNSNLIRKVRFASFNKPPACRPPRPSQAGLNWKSY